MQLGFASLGAATGNGFYSQINQPTRTRNDVIKIGSSFVIYFSKRFDIDNKSKSNVYTGISKRNLKKKKTKRDNIKEISATPPKRIESIRK